MFLPPKRLLRGPSLLRTLVPTKVLTKCFLGIIPKMFFETKNLLRTFLLRTLTHPPLPVAARATKATPATGRSHKHFGSKGDNSFQEFFLR